MKKTMILVLSVLSLLITSCATTKTEKSFTKIEAGQAIITNIDSDGAAVKYGQKADDFTNVTIVDCSKSTNRNLVTIDLADFEDLDMDFDFSCDLKFTSSKENEIDILWMVNEVNAGFPELARIKVKAGEWTHFQGTKSIALSGKRQLYISAAGIDKEDLKIYIKNFNLKLNCDEIGKEKKVKVNWADERSLAEAYQPYFDYFGFATPKAVLQNGQVIKGLEHQASCFTMENEFKPDFMFAWQKPSKFLDFVGEDGKTYKVPENTPVLGNIATILRIAKYTNLKMRGHVLVWHSQTPDWFFRENYGGNSAAFASKEEMNARLEWYIKTILEYIKNWEDENNEGKRIVVTWDVVNEAASDNASQSSWLRTNSNWYKIYKNEEFIVNAFRYANKYAPKDLLLAYNDYGCSSVAKCGAICKIVDAIQAAPDARIDVLGMQSHIGMNTPITGPNSFETSVQKFIAKGLDVQITELDIGLDGQRYNSQRLKAKYKEFFKMCLANRKSDSKYGIRGVTLWGTIDETSWIYNNNGIKNHPLLFEGNYTCKDAFYGVLEAADEEE
ncbi:MAG: endo-1,4-beta-xylanase [Treponema sp.]|nr:endo-1,4-beta-xylanase [Treponema sp.]